MAVVVLASGLFLPVAHAAPERFVFGTAAAWPAAHSGLCPAALTLATTVQVEAPAVLRYVWRFSDGDTTEVKRFRVTGEGPKTVRLSAAVEATGDARGWGAVRLLGPGGTSSKRARFRVDCAGERTRGDVWDAVSVSAEEVAPPGPEPTRDLVGKATIHFERTTASKCPLTFKVHGVLEGLPDGTQLVQYRLAGTEPWKTLKIPGGHGGVYRGVLETLDWDWDTHRSSVRIEFRQPSGLTSNTLYYFECGPPGEKERFGVTAGKVALTPAGGPLAELVADSYLEAVQAVSGAEVALVSPYGIHNDLDAGPVIYEELVATQSAGLAVDVRSMTGAQLKSILAHPGPSGWVLTPSASLRYTLEGGAVTEIALNGIPVTDTQIIKIAANYMLMGGWQGFPQWEGSTRISTSGPDDQGALASYIVKNSPLIPPTGDRVTVR